MSDLCPRCGWNLVVGTEESGGVGMEYPEVYDGVLFWYCPVCDGTWNAWPEDHPRHAIAERYRAQFDKHEVGGPF